VDQAGFRSGFSCEDHLFTVCRVLETTHEFQIPVWAATIDYRKAFDTVEHGSIWKALNDFGVPKAYIRILDNIYREQVGNVAAEVQSKTFAIKRGTKQGDPLSPALFNAVLERAMRDIQKKWRREGLGISVGEELDDRLCNLRFADDVILFASSREGLQRMLNDMVLATKAVGLQIHFGKTKVLTNVRNEDRHGANFIQLGDELVDIIHFDDGVIYLGRFLTFDRVDAAEIEHRIKKGWAKFHQFKRELCGRTYALKDKLKLFEAVITPSVLYGCASWVVTKQRENQLRTAQRQMLRRIIRVARLDAEEDAESNTTDDNGDISPGSSRDDDDEHMLEHCGETWVEWIQRATGIAEATARSCRVSNWVESQRLKMWQWAGHVARRDDGRWSKKVLLWEPTDGQRPRGHPPRRWADRLDQYVNEQMGLHKGEWMMLPDDRKGWSSWSDGFKKFE